MNFRTLLVTASTAFFAFTPSLFANETAARVEPGAALNLLREGNARFVTEHASHPSQSAERRADVAKGQHPFAVILACADSRVSPEIVFDQGLGDLFVIRNAGNVLDDDVIGSMEYAVEHLHSSLIVVLGHSSCGAVTAAVAGGEAPGHISAIVHAIQPAVELAKKEKGDVLNNAIRINAKLSTSALDHSEPILHEAVTAGHVKVVAAVYDLASGKVEFLQ